MATLRQKEYDCAASFRVLGKADSQEDRGTLHWYLPRIGRSFHRQNGQVDRPQKRIQKRRTKCVTNEALHLPYPLTIRTPTTITTTRIPSPKDHHTTYTGRNADCCTEIG